MFNSYFDSALNAINNIMGESVRFCPIGGPDEIVVGVFDSTSLEVDPASGATVLVDEPILLLKENDLNQIPNTDDKIDINGSFYIVRDVISDGRGGLTLRLVRESF